MSNMAAVCSGLKRARRWQRTQCFFVFFLRLDPSWFLPLKWLSGGSAEIQASSNLIQGTSKYI